MLRRLAAACLLLFLALPLAAQDAELAESPWEQTVTRAERALDGRADIERLEALRAEIAEARSRFLAAQDQNAARIETVQSQISALGEPPEEGQEEAEIAERRQALRSQLDELRAPVVQAEELFTAADGLVAEIDRTIRERTAERLLARDPSPLNPIYWTGVVGMIFETLGGLAGEARAAWTDDETRARMIETLPVTLPLFVLGLFLTARSRWWLRLFEDWAVRNTRRGRGVLGFVLSLGTVIVPLVGLVLIIVAFAISEFPGPMTTELLENVLRIGGAPIVANWLAREVFPPEQGRRGPLEVPAAKRETLRFYINAIGAATALLFAVNTFADLTGREDVARWIALFVPRLILAALLFRTGGILASLTRPVEDTATGVDSTLGGSFTRMFGRALRLIAVATVALAALGYNNAVDALIVPAVQTLALTGLILILQRFVSDFYAFVTGAEEGGTDALIPVLIGFALALAAMPVYALIWGARVAELTEVWSRFRAGFTLGETRVQPADFLAAILVFVLIYAATRFVQATLRGTILPKTRIDVGGRNAIVAGTGYVGLTLAALAAITSTGMNLSSLAIVAGALSVGIGFGLQTIVSNFVSGIILLIERPISEGDWIEVNGQMGYVRDISVRATRIETFDRTDVIVPNADLISGTVTNWTRGNTTGRVIVAVGVAYGSDTRRVEEILLGVARDHPMVSLNPEPWIFFSGFGDSAMNFEIRAILRDVNWVLNVQSDMHHEIARRFAEAGIEIPFPQRDVWMRSEPDAPPASPSAAAPSDEPAHRMLSVEDMDGDGEGDAGR